MHAHAGRVCARVWTPGERTLHHPLAGRVCVVRLASAAPSGTIGVAAGFSTQAALSHPVAFAFWLAPAGAEDGADPALARP